ncbi:hypothetical protein [Clostridium vincentii]|uniref:Glycosyl-4,4'-diaponeurosporenoate acyltransferase n=1 Tax=Clostridium vincentii TaxID=52704 RepID=A0A2T0BIU1_9CLOT|nr:hypothetical protein [Clostridium vincentii]PRR83794.1 hypothetical protein CLVI_07410 [Clostridium vincentii]
MTCINVVFWIILNFGIAFLMRLFPRSWFNAELDLYKEHYFEKKLYKKLNVSKWKDKLPEAGGIVGFSKKSLSKRLDISYVDRFIDESCIAEVGHILIGIVGYTSLLFTFLLPNSMNYIYIFIIFATIDFIIQMMFVVIQRYNRPRLINLRKSLTRKKAYKYYH